jgi:hypothetical protein
METLYCSRHRQADEADACDGDDVSACEAHDAQRCATLPLPNDYGISAMTEGGGCGLYAIGCYDGGERISEVAPALTNGCHRFASGGICNTIGHIDAGLRVNRPRRE